MATSIDMNTLMENMTKEANTATPKQQAQPEQPKASGELDKVRAAVAEQIQKEIEINKERGLTPANQPMSPLPPKDIKNLENFLSKQKAQVEVIEKVKKEKEAVDLVLGKSEEPQPKMEIRPQVAPEVNNNREDIEKILAFQTTQTKTPPYQRTGKETDMDLVLARRKAMLKTDTTFVTLPLSKYNARMSGLSSAEIINFVEYGRTATPSNQLEYKCRLLYNHIEEISLGKIEYLDFLKLTCELEIDILFYGIIASTQNTTNTYSFKCNKCKKEFKFDYPNEKLMMVEKEDVGIVSHMINEINNSTNPVELAKKSFAFSAPINLTLSCGDIVEFKQASLFDTLLISRKIEERKFNDSQTVERILYSILPNIASVTVPATPDRTIKLTDPNEIFDEIIAMVTLEENRNINKIVGETIPALNKIKFGFRDVTCPECANKMGDTKGFVPILSMDDLLFLKLDQMQSQWT